MVLLHHQSYRTALWSAGLCTICTIHTNHFTYCSPQANAHVTIRVESCPSKPLLWNPQLHLQLVNGSFRLEWICCSLRWSLWFPFVSILKPAVSYERKMTKFDKWVEKSSDLEREGSEESGVCVHMGTCMGETSIVVASWPLRCGYEVNLWICIHPYSACVWTSTSNSVLKHSGPCSSIYRVNSCPAQIDFWNIHVFGLP